MRPLAIAVIATAILASIIACSQPFQQQATSKAAVQSANPPSVENASAKLETISGVVMQKNTSNGSFLNSFVLNDGKRTYAIIMDNTRAGGTQVVNLRGKPVPWSFIQAGNTVTVTGRSRGLMIDALSVQVQTTKDEGG